MEYTNQQSGTQYATPQSAAAPEQKDEQFRLKVRSLIIAREELKKQNEALQKKNAQLENQLYQAQQSTALLQQQAIAQKTQVQPQPIPQPAPAVQAPQPAPQQIQPPQPVAQPQPRPVPPQPVPQPMPQPVQPAQPAPQPPAEEIPPVEYPDVLRPEDAQDYTRELFSLLGIALETINRLSAYPGGGYVPEADELMLEEMLYDRIRSRRALGAAKPQRKDAPGLAVGRQHENAPMG